MGSGSGDVGISSIRQIAINVNDLDRAREFYRETLGLTFLFDAPHLAFFDVGGVRLMLGKAEKSEFDHPASILYYFVKDIKASHDLLAKKGVQVEHAPQVVAPMPDHDLWVSFYKDTEGNYFGLMSEVLRVMDS